MPGPIRGGSASGRDRAAGHTRCEEPESNPKVGAADGPTMGWPGEPEHLEQAVEYRSGKPADLKSQESILKMETKGAAKRTATEVIFKLL